MLGDLGWNHGTHWLSYLILRNKIFETMVMRVLGLEIFLRDAFTADHCHSFCGLRKAYPTLTQVIGRYVEMIKQPPRDLGKNRRCIKIGPLRNIGIRSV